MTLRGVSSVHKPSTIKKQIVHERSKSLQTRNRNCLEKETDPGIKTMILIDRRTFER